MQAAFQLRPAADACPHQSGCRCGQMHAAAAHAAAAGACAGGGAAAARAAGRGCRTACSHCPPPLRLPPLLLGCWCWSRGTGLKPHCLTSWARSCAWGSAGCCPPPPPRPGCPAASPAGRPARWRRRPARCRRRRAGRRRPRAGACALPRPAHKSGTSSGCWRSAGGRCKFGDRDRQRGSDRSGAQTAPGRGVGCLTEAQYAAATRCHKQLQHPPAATR